MDPRKTIYIVTLVGLVSAMLLFCTVKGKEAKQCYPDYSFEVKPSMRTGYEPSVDKNIMQSLGRTHVLRFFHGWERVSIVVGVSKPPPKYRDKVCEISVKDERDWFSSCRVQIVDVDDDRIVKEYRWNRPPKYNSKMELVENSTIVSNSGLFSVMEIGLQDERNQYLDSGYYTIRCYCSMELVKSKLAIKSGQVAGFEIKDKIGENAIQVVKPSTDRERIEELLHKAYSKGLYCNDAISYLEEALSIDPTSETILLLLSKAYRKNGDIEEADRLLNECKKHHPRCGVPRL